MTNKMAAKDLFYALGLPSYGNSKAKVENIDEEDSLSFFKASLWQKQVFWMLGNIFSRN